MSTNFAKTLVWKHEYDVNLWHHKQRTPNTNDHHVPLNELLPMKIFCLRHRLLGTARWTVCILRTNWCCMRGSSQQGLQHAFDRFSDACDQAGTKISTKKIEVLCLSRRPRKCVLQVSGNILQPMETFRCVEVVFTSDRSRNKGIDTWIDNANAVLRELYCSVVTKRELSKTAKQLVFKSIFVPILTCGHKSCSRWRQRILSKEQTAEMGYLRRVLGVTLRDKEHRSEIRKARDVKALIRIERSQLC